MDVKRAADSEKMKIVKNPRPLVVVRSRKDEEKAVNLAKKNKRIFVRCADWKVIPLENLIAKIHGRSEIIAVVGTAEEAKLVLQVMELGVDGVLLETDSPTELRKFVDMRKEQGSGERVTLETATVTKVKPIGVGARACLDTCALMGEGEGMLVGSSSQGMFLVQAEVTANKLVNTRPFRVNAGAISLYVLAPKDRTNYLAELKAGDEVVLVNREGIKTMSNLARSKVEIRPMMLVEAESKDGRTAKAVLQNAETARLITPHRSMAVTELKVGNKVLVHFEEAGRHFGTLLKEETIIER
jgi:3-dehydroquinate synthase II